MPPGAAMGPPPAMPHAAHQGLGLPRKKSLIGLLILLVVVMFGLLAGFIGFLYWIFEVRGASLVPDPEPVPVAPGESFDQPATQDDPLSFSDGPAREQSTSSPAAGVRPCPSAPRAGDRWPSVGVGTTTTSCAFAEQVRVELNTMDIAVDEVVWTVVADSPVTGQSYSLTCLYYPAGTESVGCVGGDGAIVNAW
ncbi:hypothetical protein [Lolliginicoccus suaedae]|uniref:hypothetical protein n=1 Tax=Lolliginicoccus suaedae TaxID=2605429 RepID=UPI0011EC8F7D|nr:hypothetical protein [Lolliginicoccus suaedae]